MTTYGRGLRGLSLAAAATITVALALTFFYAPLDANQGFIQKIFYIHVPLAITALCGFVFGGVLAAMYLRTGDRKWDIRSYVAIHMALIFGIGTLFTGTIWAKASWGHWWVWSDPTLTSFLIVMLLFATYQPLRFSIEDPERQSRYASRVRDRRRRVRPTELHRGPGRPAVRSPARADPDGWEPAGLDAADVPGVADRYRAAVRDVVEVRDGGQEHAHAGACAPAHAARRGRGDAAEAERGAVMSVSVIFAVAPALPLHTAGKYVAGAYIVFLAMVLIYVAIMATRLSRTERDLAELRRDVEAQRSARDPDREREPVA